MYSVPIGRAPRRRRRIGPRQPPLVSWEPSDPFASQSTMLIGNTTGRNAPPDSAPAIAVASALAVKPVKPITRPKNESNVLSPVTFTPCVPDGIVPPFTCAAEALSATTAPAALRYFPETFV